MTKSKIFLILALSFIGGIFLASFFRTDIFWIFAAAIISITVLALGYKNKMALVAGLAVLFLALGLARTQTDLGKIKADLSGSRLSEKVVVAKNPEKKDGYRNVVVKTAAGEKILFRDDINSAIRHGDEIEINCLLKTPENYSISSNKTDSGASGTSPGSLDNARDKATRFDYRMYLAKDRIYYLCQSAKYTRTGKNSGNKFYAGILKVGERLEKSIDAAIPQPQAALANGLLLGGSDRMSKNMRDKFSQTGMTHIVAVSGYNVTIIAEYLIILGIFLGLWRRQAFWFAAAGIIFFVVMIGYPSSAIRAGVMGMLLLWAMKNGRLASSGNAIVFAGATMLLINPLLLRWDVGFQLSFLATIGIVALSPVWENYFIRKFRPLGFLEIVFLTLSAQIFVVPVILSNFGSFSAISLLANALILPIVPISMFFSFLTALVGIFSYWLSLPFAWAAYLLLKYETGVIEILSRAEWADIEAQNLDWLFSLLWYGTLAGLIIFLKKKIDAREKARLWNFGDAHGA